MDWEVVLRPESLAMYGEGIMTTLWLLSSSLLVGGVMAVLFALATAVVHGGMRVEEVLQAINTAP